MLNHKRSRRDFFRQYIRAGTLLLGGGLIISSCTEGKQEQEKQVTAYSGDPCSDLSNVSAEEIQKRENLGYVAESPIADNQCNNCNLYLPPGDKTCGGCMLFKGPVHAEGYCTYWAPKV
ncbi:high-potential iron-sulfur protein [Catalinimonas sp. 4WD22]|uniref:high-potential iron-sulfur protein n=1 Tax=Catalinimonas locisalis TaxID=3133978 RepID=UPI003100CE29